jgi:hypothetical protein
MFTTPAWQTKDKDGILIQVYKYLQTQEVSLEYTWYYDTLGELTVILIIIWWLQDLQKDFW